MRLRGSCLSPRGETRGAGGDAAEEGARNWRAIASSVVAGLPSWGRVWYSVGVDPHELQSRAREMRSDPTRAERVLWQELRARRLGPKFRRQVPIGPFIADFVCLERRLVVEVDGLGHDDADRDRRRDRWFTDRRWFVLRVWNEDVLEHLDATLELIVRALDDPGSIEDPWGVER